MAYAWAMGQECTWQVCRSKAHNGESSVVGEIFEVSGGPDCAEPYKTFVFHLKWNETSLKVFKQRRDMNRFISMAIMLRNTLSEGKGNSGNKKTSWEALAIFQANPDNSHGDGEKWLVFSW